MHKHDRSVTRPQIRLPVTEEPEPANLACSPLRFPLTHHTPLPETMEKLWRFRLRSRPAKTFARESVRDRQQDMKPQRLVYRPTRSPRLNEMLGLVALAIAAVLLLALITYTPSDPSFNTVGGTALTRPAHNWIGLFGAYLSDALLQVFGAAVLFVPLVVLRIGISWMRSRAVGSGMAKSIGLALWLLFAPPVIALLPGHVLWRHTIPVEGVEGRLLADSLVSVLNFPGASVLCTLMVVLSLYLATTFTLSSAREWFTSHFAFARNIRDRYNARQQRKRDEEADKLIGAYESKRERAIEKARLRAAKADPAAATVSARANTSLLASFFGWSSHRKPSNA